MIETPWGMYPDADEAAAALEFQAGDIVYLASGGPPMTVLRCDGDTILVSWFEGEAMRIVSLPFDAVFADEGVPRENEHGDTLH